MNDNEVYEYRAQVRQYIDALGKNPEEELPLVTIEEMRAWIDDFEESERERAKEEDGENYDPEMWKGTLYPDLELDPKTGLLTTDFFKFHAAEFVYVHMLAEQCFKDPSKVDWKTVTCGYNHKVISTLRNFYCNPLVWTGMTPDMETKYMITGDVAQEVHMVTRLHDDKMMLQDRITFEGALLWFADELPKGNHPLVWMVYEPLPAPEDMIIWSYITANYGAMPSDDLPEEERDFSLVYFAPQNLRWNMDFIAKHRGGKRAAEIVRLLRDDWYAIKAQKLFGMELITAEQVEQFEFALFAGMDRSLRIWDAEEVKETKKEQSEKSFSLLTDECRAEGKEAKVISELRTACKGTAVGLWKVIRTNEALDYLGTRGMQTSKIYRAIVDYFGELPYSERNFRDARDKK